jgi:hypothetical protein
LFGEARGDWKEGWGLYCTIVLDFGRSSGVRVEEAITQQVYLLGKGIGQ